LAVPAGLARPAFSRRQLTTSIGPVNNTAGVTTNGQGEAMLNFAHPGKYKVKASRSDSLRSNPLVLKVS
jgi:hypothetical protein